MKSYVLRVEEMRDGDILIIETDEVNQEAINEAGRFFSKWLGDNKLFSCQVFFARKGIDRFYVVRDQSAKEKIEKEATTV